MRQKITWMLYLLIGISSISLAPQCGKSEDADIMIVTVDLIYMNKTDSTISFNVLEDLSSNLLKEVKLLPQSSSGILTYKAEVNRNSNAENCCQDVLINAYASRALAGSLVIVTINDSLCVVHLNEKSVLISNYAVEIITNRHFRYTYTFTRYDFENAALCE